MLKRRMEFKLRRIKISLRSAYRYCTKGYWRDFNKDVLGVLVGFGALFIVIWKLLIFIPYCIMDIIFSILLAPFFKQIDRFDETFTKKGKKK